LPRPTCATPTTSSTVEVYLVPASEEHLAQHEGRLTGSDEADDRRADALAE
jgi:hypothetical protein